MRSEKNSIRMAILALPTALLLFFPFQALSQDFPTKPITIYVGYEPGATVDLSVRVLAKAAEKLLGVPVVVENKPGGSASVCAALVARKPPDGYTLGAVNTVLLNARPHLIPTPYDSLKDFTFILQYDEGTGGLCVLSESPLKTIDDFIKYAKAHPGLSYGSAGIYGRGHLAIELFAQCKGLTFKHVPFSGGAPSCTALLGKHTDFLAGAGTHHQYIRQGAFRMLMVTSAEKRDPHYPDIPMLKDLGCQDVPPDAGILVGPRGIPDAISKKLGEVFKDASETPDFRKILEQLFLNYSYKDREQLEKDLESQYEWYRTFLSKMGVKKAG